MASPACLRHGHGMNRAHEAHDFAKSTETLRRAAAEFEQSASAGGTNAALPEALEYLKETLELLARGVEKASQAVEDPAQQQGVGLENEPLSPPARALQWHLSHLSARLLGARDVCPKTRRWARELLHEFDPVPDDKVGASTKSAMRPPSRTRPVPSTATTIGR